MLSWYGKPAIDSGYGSRAATKFEFGALLHGTACLLHTVVAQGGSEFAGLWCNTYKQEKRFFEGLVGYWQMCEILHQQCLPLQVLATTLVLIPCNYQLQLDYMYF